MQFAASLLTGLVAVLHVWFLILEMFLWTTPYGRRTFGMTEEKAQATRVLAANQGLYNGFLAAGLAWGLWIGDLRLKCFFLACVMVAGAYGAVTANKRIVFVQALPAALALALTLLARG